MTRFRCWFAGVLLALAWRIDPHDEHPSKPCDCNWQPCVDVRNRKMTTPVDAAR